MRLVRASGCARRATTEEPSVVTRRAFLAIGGLCVLSACETPAAGGQAGGSAQPARTVAPARSVPPVPPMPSPLAPESAPRYKVDPAKAVPGQKTVALTIDDGPDPQWTPKVLDILREHKITATFFMVGTCVTANPDLVRQVAAAGHTVATHTWSHQDLRKLPAPDVRAEIGRCLDAVAAASPDRRPTLFRAPYGNWSPAAFAVCAEFGLRSIAWSVDPRDWEEPGAERITSRVLAQTGSRGIVLNHDGGGNRSQTVAAMRDYLPRLLADGYQFVTL
jgi:peptidoglycan/xylan/chitin deacetylase (PgdA/CDA1 family)